MVSILKKQSLETIQRRSSQAEEHGLHPDFGKTIDASRWFVCPTVTPLYYAPIYNELSPDQQRRYNQLTALCFNELIAFFEESFAASVLAAIADQRSESADAQFVECLHGFLREERRHIGYWRQLNQRTEPAWYAKSHNAVIRQSPLALRSLRFLTARPHRFPVVFWIMLALEERSLDISRRCLDMDRDTIEPTYRQVHQHHLRDETRHVQLDWHLIERFYARLPMRRRRWNARLLAMLIGRFFLPPTRSAVQVVRRLVADHPELAPQLPNIVQQLRTLGSDASYHEMMYSRATTPLMFALFDRFEEMHRMCRVLQSYQFAVGSSIA